MAVYGAAHWMPHLLDWVETYRRFWDDQFDALAEYLEREQENSNAQPTNKPKENEK